MTLEKMLEEQQKKATGLKIELKCYQDWLSEEQQKSQNSTNSESVRAEAIQTVNDIIIERDKIEVELFFTDEVIEDIKIKIRSKKRYSEQLVKLIKEVSKSNKTDAEKSELLKNIKNMGTNTFTYGKESVSNKFKTLEKIATQNFKEVFEILNETLDPAIAELEKATEKPFNETFKVYDGFNNELFTVDVPATPTFSMNNHV